MPDVHVTSDVNRYYVESGKSCDLYAMFEVFYPPVSQDDTRSLGWLSGGRQVRVCFCIDVSGSMKDEGKLEVAKAGVINYVERLEPTDYVSVVTFDKKGKVVAPLQPAVNKGEIIKKIMALKAGTYTNLYDGIRLAYAVVEGVEVEAGRSLLDKLLSRKPTERAPPPPPNSVKRIILLTDGIPTIGVMDPEDYRKIGEQFKRIGISVMAAGIGVEYDDKILEALSTSSGGIWRHVLQPNEIIQFFEETVTEIKRVAIPNLELIINPFEEVELVEAYRIGDTISRIDITHTANGGAITIPLEDLKLGARQRVVIKLHVKPMGIGKKPVVRYTLAGEGLEKERDMFVEVTDDPTLYSHETNPLPRLQFLLSEGTLLASRGLDNKQHAQQALDRVHQLLSSPDSDIIRSDKTLLLMSETILKSASTILKKDLTPAEMKKLREETTVMKSKG